MITAIICISVVVLAIVIVLTILVYNQMLLLNEVNKRLLLYAKESIDKERSTTEELQEALHQLDALANEMQSNTIESTEEVNQPFNPHTYNDPDLN